MPTCDKGGAECLLKRTRDRTRRLSTRPLPSTLEWAPSASPYAGRWGRAEDGMGGEGYGEVRGSSAGESRGSREGTWDTGHGETHLSTHSGPLSRLWTVGVEREVRGAESPTTGGPCNPLPGFSIFGREAPPRRRSTTALSRNDSRVGVGTDPWNVRTPVPLHRSSKTPKVGTGRTV